MQAILKFFSYESPAEWAAEQSQYKKQDLKEDNISAEYLQSFQEEMKRIFDRLKEIAKVVLMNDPSGSKDLFEKALPAEVLAVLANTFSFTGSSALIHEIVKNENRHLLESLLGELLSLVSGDNVEVCRLAGELLLMEKPNCFEQYPWMAVRLASIAEGDYPLEKRLSLITAMANLHEKSQRFNIAHCFSRDTVVEALIAENKWPELLSLIRFAFLRWELELDGTADLNWLTKTLILIKSACQGAKAQVKLKVEKGLFQASSKILLEHLISETVSAAAVAWHRCLRGPGGVHFCLDNMWVFNDKELAGEILETVARDPVVFITLVEEAVEHGRGQEIERLPVLEHLLEGVVTSEYCLTNLLKHSLVIAARDPNTIIESVDVLRSAGSKLLPFLDVLFKEFSLGAEKER